AASATAREATPVAGPLAGTLDPVGDQAALTGAGTALADFAARVRWAVPDGDASWDAGFAFRDQPDGRHYRLMFDSSGGWTFGIGTEPSLAAGQAPLALADGAVNTVELVVMGDRAGFSVNGEFVSTLDVSALRQPGDVWFGAGFSAADAASGVEMRYRDFTIWDVTGLPSVTPVVPSPVATTPVAEPPTAPETIGIPTASVPTATATPIATATPVATATPTPPAATPPAAAGMTAVNVQEQNDSGVAALATITEVEGLAYVNLAVRGGAPGELAVIHEGSCADLGAPAFLLNDPDASGRSKTPLGAPVDEVRGGGFALAIHPGFQDLSTTLACGDIGG
ncbi:MAG: hypothetical protein IT337_08985, partial [Thermomicrobiales bacterium]|nr:hypothetical protein [Thermomicrobiales bacterium]